jgi:DHA2 family multidrug resistance protein
VFFGANVVIPLWLQTQMGYTSAWAGRLMGFGSMLAIFLGPMIGANIHRLDPRWIATMGFCVFALWAFLTAAFPPDVDFWTMALTRLMMGIGVASFFMPANTISLSGLPQARLASASGMMSFMRNLGSSFGTAIVTARWDRLATVHHARLSESVRQDLPVAQNTLDQLAAAGLSHDQALAYVDRIVGQQAYSMATNGVLCSCAMLMISLIGIIWWARPPFGAAAGGGPRAGGGH